MDIWVDGIEKTYGGVRALEPLRTCLRQGSLVTVLDPSGCGKTTFLLILAGLPTPAGYSSAKPASIPVPGESTSPPKGA